MELLLEWYSEKQGRRAVTLHAFSNFLNHMDWQGFFEFLLSVFAVLLCLTFHEVSHGYMAYRLGDKTAKSSGRLSLNPFKHIDPLGFLLMLTAGVGWAKPVPVNPTHFKNPKRGMAITALAGPIANFLLALLFAVPVSIIYNNENIFYFLTDLVGWNWFQILFQFLVNLVVLNVGLGLFNLFPIPPLDGSKVLFSFLPTKIYWTILKYEKYVMIALMLLLWCGILDTPLNWLIDQGLYGIGILTRCSFWY